MEEREQRVKGLAEGMELGYRPADGGQHGLIRCALALVRLIYGVDLHLARASFLVEMHQVGQGVLGFPLVAVPLMPGMKVSLAAAGTSMVVGKTVRPDSRSLATPKRRLTWLTTEDQARRHLTYLRGASERPAPHAVPVVVPISSSCTTPASV